MTIVLDKILVLDFILKNKSPKLTDFEKDNNLSKGRLKDIIGDLTRLEFVETTGKTNNLRYIIHKSKLQTTADEKTYIYNKKQEKQKQIETILRYLDEFGEIYNEKARELLVLPDNQIYTVSRLLKEMTEKALIIVDRREKNKIIYKRK